MADPSRAEIGERHVALLNEQIFAILTTVRADGLLSSNPVCYVWDGANIKVSTLKSRMKYRNLQRDPRVCFCVQSFANPLSYLEVRGTATLADDPQRAFAREQYMRGMGEEPPADLDPPDAERAVITIHPRQVSAPRIYGGRFHGLYEK